MSVVCVELQPVQLSCVLRACRYKREMMVSDRERLVNGYQQHADLVTGQAIEVLNAELCLLDGAIDEVWRKLAGQALTEISSRRELDLK